MLTSFPTPYPDELLYSLFARYHVRAGNTSASMTSKDLFGKSAVRSVWDLPSNLRLFTERVGGMWNAEVLVSEHTLYNYYAPFLRPQQAFNVKKSMLGNEGNIVHTMAGLTRTKVNGKLNMWMCEDCLLSDLNMYGETYWHRVHQIIGVFICPHHGKLLSETCVPTHEIHSRVYHIAHAGLVRNELDINQFTERDIELFYKMATLTNQLLTSSFHPLIENSIKECYFVRLRTKGYATKHIKMNKLFLDFNSFFTDHYLEFMNSSLSTSKSDWLRKMCQSHRNSFHPIRHLLLLMFLDIGLEELFMVGPRKQEIFLKTPDYSYASTSFGTGPWPCLNAICSLHRLPAIKTATVVIDSKSRKPVGTFECECGFTYVRSGPDVNGEAKYKIGKVKEYGVMWEERLARLISEEKSLISISEELHVCGATVKKYAFKLGIETPWKKPLNQNKIVNSGRKRTLLEKYKAKYLLLKKEYPDNSRSELQKRIPEVHGYLRKYDNDWLKDNFPPKKKAVRRTENVNWVQRDEEILDCIKEVISDWDKNEDVLTRKTRTAISKKINKVDAISKTINRLPKTKKYLEEVTEDYETFKRRKVQFISDQYKKTWLPLTEAAVHRKVGHVGIDRDTKIFIALKVAEHNAEVL